MAVSGNGWSNQRTRLRSTHHRSSTSEHKQPASSGYCDGSMRQMAPPLAQDAQPKLAGCGGGMLSLERLSYTPPGRLQTDLSLSDADQWPDHVGREHGGHIGA